MAHCALQLATWRAQCAMCGCAQQVCQVSAHATCHADLLLIGCGQPAVMYINRWRDTMDRYGGLEHLLGTPF